MKCPNCNSETDYDLIGNHWRQTCSYPEPSDYQIRLLDGLMMGDACLSRSGKGNPSIDVISINRQFLDWLDESLGVISSGVEVKRSQEEAVEQAKQSDVISSDCNVSEIYRLRCRRLPFFERYEEWYESGKKSFPVGIEICSVRAKFWYVCDGGLCWNKKSRSARAQICSTNEQKRLDEIVDWFTLDGFDPIVHDERLMLDREGTESFLSWLGDPVPGFSYKWKDNDLESYERAKQ